MIPDSGGTIRNFVRRLGMIGAKEPHMPQRKGTIRNSVRGGRLKQIRS